MRKSFSIISVLLLAVTLGACNSNVRHTIGLKRQVPDAFKVVSNPPLSVPPDFSLPAPQLGAIPPSENIAAQTQAMVFQAPNTATKDNLSPADNVLLMQAKANEADPEIIAILKKEQQEDERKLEEKNAFQKIISKVSPNEKPEPIVNASKEKERLVKNQQEGKSVTEGHVHDTSGNTGGGFLNRVLGL